MAIARDSAAAQVNKGSSYTNTAGDLLVLTAAYDGAAGDLGTPSYGGVDLTFVGRVTNGALNRQAELWYLPSPATGSNTFTYTGTPAFVTLSALASFSGFGAADTSGASTFEAGTTTQDVTLTMGTDAWAVMVVWDNTGSISAHTNLTKYVTGAFGVAAYLDTNGPFTGATTLKASVTNSNSIGLAWSFTSGGGGGGAGGPIIRGGSLLHSALLRGGRLAA